MTEPKSIPKPLDTLSLSHAEYLEAKEMKKMLPKFYFRDAMGSYVFIKTRDRAKALQYIKDEYDGKYALKSYTMDGASSDEASCRATETRRGQAKGRNEMFGVPRGLK
jgi:hypothetical protein